MKNYFTAFFKKFASWFVFGLALTVGVIATIFVVQAFQSPSGGDTSPDAAGFKSTSSYVATMLSAIKAKTDTIPTTTGMTFAGYTASTYDGAGVGGTKGANDKCQAAYAGSHACTWNDLKQMGSNYPWSSDAWIVDGTVLGPVVAGLIYQNTADGNTYTSTPWQYINCSGWKNSNNLMFGSFASITGNLSQNRCDIAYKLPCCK